VTVVVEVCPESVPRPLLSVQLTPAAVESLLTVAVINTVPPWSRLTGPVGESATAIAGGAEAEVPQPAMNKRDIRAEIVRILHTAAATGCEGLDIAVLPFCVSRDSVARGAEWESRGFMLRHKRVQGLRHTNAKLESLNEKT
jgi:hypothetical protein